MRVLPATQTLGTLSHRTFVLELSIHSRSQFYDATTGKIESKPARVLSHEMTHWFDIVGSMWGQHYIDALFMSYDAILRNPAPAIEPYPAALKQFDAERTILFPSYFKFVKAEAEPQQGPGKWRMEITTGIRFHADGNPNPDDPILFVRFADDKGVVARQPVSVGALLEMKAIAAEIHTYRSLHQLRPRDEGLVENLFFQKEGLAQLYDPELTTYSVAAHLFSDAVLGIFPTDLVMILGPRLVDIALNVKPILFQRLKVPEQLSAGGQRRLSGFRKMSDRGFLYGCFCMHMRGLSRHLTKSGDVVDAILSKAGLPNKDEIFSGSINNLESRRPSQLQDKRLRRIRTVLQQAGIEILRRRRDPDPISLEEWKDLPSPRIMDCEAEAFLVGHEVISESDSDFLNDCSFKLDETIRSVLRASRGLEFQFTDFVY